MWFRSALHGIYQVCITSLLLGFVVVVVKCYRRRLFRFLHVVVAVVVDFRLHGLCRLETILNSHGSVVLELDVQDTRHDPVECSGLVLGIAGVVGAADLLRLGLGVGAGVGGGLVLGLKLAHELLAVSLDLGVGLGLGTLERLLALLTGVGDAAGGLLLGVEQALDGSGLGGHVG